MNPVLGRNLLYGVLLVIPVVFYVQSHPFGEPNRVSCVGDSFPSSSEVELECLVTDENVTICTEKKRVIPVVEVYREELNGLRKLF